MKGTMKNAKMALGTFAKPETRPSCDGVIPKPPEVGATPAHNVTASRTPRNVKEKKALTAMRRMRDLVNRRLPKEEEEEEVVEEVEEEEEDEKEVEVSPPF